MKVGIPERLTSLSLGTSTARRLSHYAGVPTWLGAEQFFLTVASLASWASSSFDAICAGDGFGRQLWRYLLERLQARLAPGASIGMDGVFAMAPFYERSGFVFAHK